MVNITMDRKQGIKINKLNKKKIGLCVVVVLLVSALAYAFVRKQVFDQKVQKAQSEVEYYESDEGLSKSNLEAKLSDEHDLTKLEIDHAVSEEGINFNTVAYDKARNLMREGLAMEDVYERMTGSSIDDGNFTKGQVEYALQKIADKQIAKIDK